MRRRSAFILLLGIPAALFAKKEWRQGQLLSVEIKDFERGKHNIDHRYVCTIADGDIRYLVEYEKPLKAVVNDPVKFFIDKDNLIIQDADGKERSARIEKRERSGPPVSGRN